MKTVVVGTWKNVLGTFLTGLFALLPLVITVAIVAWVVNFFNNLVGPKTLIGEGLIYVGLRFVANEYAATAIGWGVVLAGIFLTGVFVKTRAKALVDMLFNPIIRRIPVINSVYGTASQFVGMLNKQDKSELSGMSVVFARFGEPLGAGILALMPTRDVYEMDGRRCHLIYIPTSPVPMTGGLLYVPIESVTRLEMPVESLMSIYLSMGVTSSQAVKPAAENPPSGNR